MSNAKRSRRRQSEASAAPLPASKRLKTTKSSHVPAQSGLGFLVDENKRAGKRVTAHLTNGVQDSRAARVDESQTVVAQNSREEDEPGVKDAAREVIELSSGVSESCEYESSEAEHEDNGTQNSKALASKPLANGHMTATSDEDASDDDSEADAVGGAEDVPMRDADDTLERDHEDPEAVPAEEQSFGERLQASHPEPIDVQASFADPMADSQALVPASGDRVLVAPSATSLGTVLTQALRTNDKALLESCFQMNDVSSIRSTIQRLQSSLVASLLQKLAERIHKRPGRTGTLMIWVQWSLVAHGGYLAGQPEVMKKLRSLSQVVRERASGLQPLLTLKGKLDMLTAQLELRKSMQAVSRMEDDGDDEAVIYVEGQGHDWSDDDADDVETSMKDEKALPSHNPGVMPSPKSPNLDESAADESSEDDEAMPTTNGIMHDDDDDDSAVDEDQEADAGMFDEEGEETSDDEGEDTSAEEDSDAESELEEDASISGESSASSVQPQNQQVRKALNRKR